MNPLRTPAPGVYDTLLRDTELSPVQLGAELLDHVSPGWEEEIDLDSLDLASCTRCILGQLFGIFDIGDLELAECLGVVEDELDLDFFGFSVNGLPDDYADLTEDWRTLITDRRLLTTNG
jgi:hypothetical protein